MAKRINPINNPLTLIALFAGLAETSAAAALPFLDPHAQAVFLWFVMLFPVLIAASFFLTLNFNHRVLYAPSDYADEKHFLEIAQGRYASDREVAERLKQFWKPKGWISEENESIMKNWMRSNFLEGVPIPLFISGDLFAQARRQMADDLNITKRK